MIRSDRKASEAGRIPRLPFRAALALFFLLPAASCIFGCAVVGEGITLEKQFTERQVRAIKIGRTSKKDVLAWFGPPLAVARPGTAAKIPRHGVVTPGCDDVPAEEVFSRFPETANRREGLAVYYYRDVSLHRAVLVFEHGSIPSRPTLEVTELWVLIDEKSGSVSDYQAEVTDWEACAQAGRCRDDEPPQNPKKRKLGESTSRPESGLPWEEAQ